MTCKHTITHESDARCHQHGVAVEPYTAECRAAHSGVTYTQRCRCGAERLVNMNQAWEEFGPWRQPDRKFVGRVSFSEGYHVYLGHHSREALTAVPVTRTDGEWRAFGEPSRIDLEQMPSAAIRLVTRKEHVTAMHKRVVAD